jgi:uronate dehydrogenase
MGTRWNRILITGAAGRLGQHLRSGLSDLSLHLRSTDLREFAAASALEECVLADLSDVGAVRDLMSQVDVVLHFGAVMPQEPWERVLPANVVGTWNVFEAARQAGVRRVVYASSHHAVGMYPRTQNLDTDAMARPDTPYGLSKAFGESVARMYFDKYGIEAACLRIGSCFPRPSDERMLATWLSLDDMLQLARRCVEAPVLGCAIVYGMSNNSRRWWNNERVAWLGFEPQDSADPYAPAILDNEARKAAGDPAVFYQGGRFVNPA